METYDDYKEYGFNVTIPLDEDEDTTKCPRCKCKRVKMFPEVDLVIYECDCAVIERKEKTLVLIGHKCEANLWLK